MAASVTQTDGCRFRNCGQCSPPSYNGETGDCIESTTATYNVQCKVEGTAITMVFDVTDVTNTDIGPWTCNPVVGIQPEADIIITVLGKVECICVDAVVGYTNITPFLMTNAIENLFQFQQDSRQLMFTITWIGWSW